MNDCKECKHYTVPVEDEPCRSCDGPIEPRIVSHWEPAEPPAPAPADAYHVAKHDAGKLRWDCLPWPAVEAVVAVLTYGASKYTAWSWPSMPDARTRYFAAAQRHLTAWLRGEHTDSESSLPHLAHAACDVLFLLAFDLGAAAPPVAFTKPAPKAGE